MKGTRGREGAFAGAWWLGLAGFFAIAVAFGPARSGFGLFLPDFRREFGLSTEVSGMIAGGSYGGYLVALSLVGLLAARSPFTRNGRRDLGHHRYDPRRHRTERTPARNGAHTGGQLRGLVLVSVQRCRGARGPISVARPGVVGHKHWHHLRTRDGRSYRASGRRMGPALACRLARFRCGRPGGHSVEREGLAGWAPGTRAVCPAARSGPGLVAASGVGSIVWRGVVLWCGERLLLVVRGGLYLSIRGSAAGSGTRLLHRVGDRGLRRAPDR